MDWKLISDLCGLWCGVLVFGWCSYHLWTTIFEKPQKIIDPTKTLKQVYSEITKGHNPAYTVYRDATTTTSNIIFDHPFRIRLSNFDCINKKLIVGSDILND